MKYIAMFCVVLLTIISVDVVAEEHADTALEHARMAVEQGKAGDGPVLVEHASEALTHAKKAAESTTGQSRTHLDIAVTSLESAIQHGKSEGAEHLDAALQSSEAAVEHISAASQ